MSSQPPIVELLSERPAPGPSLSTVRPHVRRSLESGEREAGDEPASQLEFSIEDAPPTSGTAERIGRELRLLQDVEGELVRVSDTHLELASERGLARVRFAVPSEISFEPLRGRVLRLQITRRYGAVATVDVQIRDAENGWLLFWARDGQFPGGDDRSLSFSASPTLDALVASGPVADVSAPLHATTVVAFGAAQWRLAVFMVAEDRCAFAMSRSASTEA